MRIKPPKNEFNDLMTRPSVLFAVERSCGKTSLINEHFPEGFPTPKRDMQMWYLDDDFQGSYAGIWTPPREPDQAAMQPSLKAQASPSEKQSIQPSESSLHVVMRLQVRN